MEDDGSGEGRPLRLRKAVSPDTKARALIINIYHYELPRSGSGSGENKDRLGSEKDIENLAGIFHKLNLGVYTPEGGDKIKATKSKITTWIKMFKEKLKEEAARQNDKGEIKMASFVCIMGHGAKNGLLIDSHHKEINIEKDIFNMFNNKNFPEMRNQPKIFFVNCCRGRESESDDDGPSDPETKPKPKPLPRVADILIYWSTTPVTPSRRNTVHGSIFVRVLCQILLQHVEQLSSEADPGFHDEKVAHGTDIETILKAVAVEMRGYVHEKKGKQYSQTPNIDNRSFAHFRWLVQGFEYSREDWLPLYLRLSEEEKEKLKLIPVKT